MFTREELLAERERRRRAREAGMSAPAAATQRQSGGPPAPISAGPPKPRSTLSDWRPEQIASAQAGARPGASAADRLNAQTFLVQAQSGFSDVTPSAKRFTPEWQDPQLDRLRQENVLSRAMAASGAPSASVGSLLDANDPAVSRIVSRDQPSAAFDRRPFMPSRDFQAMTPERQQAEVNRMASVSQFDQQRRQDVSDARNRAAGRMLLDTGTGPTFVDNPAVGMGAEAAARQEERNRQERREAARVNMGDMIVTQDALGRLQPGTDVDRDIGKGLLTAPVNIANAAISAGESAINLPIDAFNAMADKYYSTGNTSRDQRIGAPRLDVPEIPLPEELQSVTGALTKGLAQFLIGRGAIGKALPGGGLAAQIGKDALTVGTVFDGSTGRIADMIDPSVIPEGPLRDYAAWLRTQPDDSELVGRFKNFLEDMTVSGPFVAPQAVVSGGRAINRAVNPPSIPTNAGGARLGPPPSPRQAYNAMPEAERRAVVERLQQAGMTNDEIVAAIRSGNTEPPVQPTAQQADDVGPSPEPAPALEPPPQAAAPAGPAPFSRPGDVRAPRGNLVLRNADRVVGGTVGGMIASPSAAASAGDDGSNNPLGTAGGVVAGALLPRFAAQAGGRTLRAAQRAAGGAKNANRFDERIASSTLRKQFERAGLTSPAAVQEAMRAAFGNQPATLADLTQEGLSTAVGLTRLPGSTAENAARRAAELADTSMGRTQAGIEDAIRGVNPGLNPGTIAGDVDELIAAAQAEASPLYQALRAQYPLGSLDSGRLMELLDQDIMRPHVQAAQRYRDTIAISEGRQVGDFEFVDIVKRSLDDAEQKAISRNERVPYDLESARVALLEEMDRLVPRYAEARRLGGEAPRMRQAFSEGQRLLQGRFSVEDIGRIIQETTGAALTATQAGVIRAMIGKVETGRGALQALTGPGTRQKLARVFGQEAADAMQARFKAEEALMRNARQMDPNVGSVTSRAMLSEPAGIGPMIAEAVNTVRNPLEAGLAYLSKSGAYSQAQRDLMGEMLLGGATDANLARIFPPGRTRPPRGRRGGPPPAAPQGGPPPAGGRGPAAGPASAGPVDDLPRGPAPAAAQFDDPTSRSPAFIGGAGVGAVTGAAMNPDDPAAGALIGAGVGGVGVAAAGRMLGRAGPPPRRMPPGRGVDAMGLGGGSRQIGGRGSAAERFSSAAIKRESKVADLSRSKLIEMPIDDFLRLARKGNNDQKLSGVKGLLDKNEPFESLPYLMINRDGSVRGHEGRHRARALKDAGYDTMPVIVRSENIRWSEQGNPNADDYVDEWPRQLTAEAGAESPGFAVPFPISREQATQPYRVGSAPTRASSDDIIRQAQSQGYNGQDIGEAQEWVRAREKGLDMSQGARMERARAMGFDTDTVLYHGTADDFVDFDTEELGKATRGGGAEYGFFFTSSQRQADDYRRLALGYGEGSWHRAPQDKGRVIQITTRGNYKTVDMPTLERQTAEAAGVEYTGLPDILGPQKVWMGQIVDQAKREGFDGVEFVNILDDPMFGETGERATHRLVFNPANIRSVNAAFDPDFAESPNILAQAKKRGYAGQDIGEATEWVRAREKGLDMSQPARLERARAMGFDTETVLYHGTTADFKAFDVSASSQAAAFGPGVYLSVDPTDAGRWAKTKEGASVIPVYIKRFDVLPMEPLSKENAARLSVYLGRQINEGDPVPYTSLERRAGSVSEGARAAGFAGVEHAGPSGTRHVVITDPANIRSVNAAFDPAEAGSRNILAGMGANPAATGALAGGAAGVVAPYDTDGDGVIDANDRAASVIGNMITGGVGGAVAGRLMPGAARRGPPTGPATMGVGGRGAKASAFPTADDAAIRQGPTFYSALTRAVEKSPTKSAPASQWKSTLANSPGIKAEEIEWTGVNDWLDLQQGNVTRDELAAYLQNNGVQVEEVVKVADGAGDASVDAIARQLFDESWDTNTWDDWMYETRKNRLMELFSKQPDSVKEEYYSRYMSRSDGEKRAYLDWADYEFGTSYDDTDLFSAEEIESIRDEAWELTYAEYRERAEQLVDDGDIGGEGSTKWSAFKLPGGQNYTELLLKLPETSLSPEAASAAARLNEIDPTINKSSGRRWDDNEVQELRQIVGRAKDEQKVKNYQSSHWEEPNVLAHVRFSERTSADGKRILAIDEIQSDWHQAGREKGYDTAEWRQERERVLKQVNAELLQRSKRDNELYDQVVALARSPEYETYFAEAIKNFNVMGDEYQAAQRMAGRSQFVNGRMPDGLLKQRLLDLMKERDLNEIALRGLEARAHEASRTNIVPNAPFKNNAWASLSLKRMIRHAAENGFDEIAWVPGQVPVERFSLSKQIDSLSVTDAPAAGDDMVILSAYKNGRSVLEETIPRSKLKDYVGAEAAEKVLAKPKERITGARSLDGVDLNVGGAGMKAFYDQILVNEANKIGKKYGVSVKTRQIYTPAGRDGSARIEAGPKTFYSMEITPKVRKMALEGQPLFAFPGAGNLAQAGAGVGGAAYGYARGSDLNEDGVIDDQERMTSAVALGALGLGTAGLARARMGMGRAKPPSAVKAGPPVQRPVVNASVRQRGAPKPPKGPPGAVSRMVAGGAAGGAVGALAGEAIGQDDLTADIAKTRQEIEDLQAALKEWDKLDVTGKQELLVKLGRVQSYYTNDKGKRVKFADGTTGDRTEAAFNAYVKDKTDALTTARNNLIDFETRSAYREFQQEQNPFMTLVRDLAPPAAMLLAGAGATVLRMRAVGKSKEVAREIESDINNLLTKGEVRKLVKRGGAEKEERNRAANINEFYRLGGAAPDQERFIYGKGGYQPNPKAAKPGTLYAPKTTTKMDKVGSQFLRPNDMKLIGVGVLDSVAINPFVDSAQKELDAAQKDVDGGNKSIEALRRLEKAKTELAMYQTIQRIGWGLAGFGVLGAGYRYKLPRPDIRGAEEEAAAISDYLRANAPPKPPRAPRAPRTQPPAVVGPPKPWWQNVLSGSNKPKPKSKKP